MTTGKHNLVKIVKLATKQNRSRINQMIHLLLILVMGVQQEIKVKKEILTSMKEPRLILLMEKQVLVMEKQVLAQKTRQKLRGIRLILLIKKQVLFPRTEQELRETRLILE